MIGACFLNTRTPAHVLVARQKRQSGIDLGTRYGLHLFDRLGNVSKGKHRVGLDCSVANIVTVQMNQKHAVDMLPGALRTNLLGTGVFYVVMFGIGFDAGRRLDLIECRRSIAHIFQCVYTCIKTVVCRELRLKTDIPIISALKAPLDAPFHLIAFTHKLLHESGEFTMGVMIRVFLQKPEGFRAIEVLDEIGFSQPYAILK